MNQKTKSQKGFIQIPLLIGIIVFVVGVSVATTGVVLHKQGKQVPLITNILEVFEKTEEVANTKEVKLEKPQIEQPEINQEEIIQQKLRQTKLETEKAKAEAERLRKETEETKRLAEEKVKQAAEKARSEEEARIKAEQELQRQLEAQRLAEEQHKQEELKKQQEETYAYHNYYPIILSLSDNKGNILKSSNYNNYKGLYSWGSWQKQTLKIGDEIYLKVEASDPQNRQILYNWHSNSQYFNQLIGLEGGRYKWTTNNELRYKVTAEDMKSAGENMRIVVYIKSEKEYLRCPQCPNDDATYIDYILSP